MAKKNRKSQELWNVVTHGTGAVLSVIALTVMVLYSVYHNGTVLHIAVSVIFGSSLVLLYSASTVYHWAWTLRWKRLSQPLLILTSYIFNGV